MTLCKDWNFVFPLQEQDIFLPAVKDVFGYVADRAISSLNREEQEIEVILSRLVQDKGLLAQPRWIAKAIQLYQLSKVHHGNDLTIICSQYVNPLCYVLCSTVETRIKEPTFLSDSLLKALIFFLYNPYIRDGVSASLIKTCTDCMSIAVAFSPIIYFIFKAVFV